MTVVVVTLLYRGIGRIKLKYSNGIITVTHLYAFFYTFMPIPGRDYTILLWPHYKSRGYLCLNSGESAPPTQTLIINILATKIEMFQPSVKRRIWVQANVNIE